VDGSGARRLGTEDRDVVIALAHRQLGGEARLAAERQHRIAHRFNQQFVADERLQQREEAEREFVLPAFHLPHPVLLREGLEQTVHRRVGYAERLLQRLHRCVAAPLGDEPQHRDGFLQDRNRVGGHRRGGVSGSQPPPAPGATSYSLMDKKAN
jgi:hypothetical protein